MTNFTVTITLDTREEELLDALVEALDALDPVGSLDDHGYVRARVTLASLSAFVAVREVEQALHAARIDEDASAEFHVTSAKHLDLSEPGGEREITVERATTMLGVSRQRVHQMVAAGTLSARRVGRELALLKRDVVEAAATR